MTVPPGDVFSPDENLWLLVTLLDTSKPIKPKTPLLWLENLRLVTETSTTLTFLLTDHFRGKFDVGDWLQLIAMIFCRQAKDTVAYNFSTPISVRDAFDSVDNWCNLNNAGRKHPRSVWWDKSAAMAFLTTEPIPRGTSGGERLIYQQR